MRAASIDVGAGSFHFVDGEGHAGRRLTVLYYHPPHLTVTSPIVFVMHGTKRDASNYRNIWAPVAEEFQFLLVCPEFDAANYARGAYNVGNMVDQAGRPRAASEWTFSVIERLFDFVKTATGNTSAQYYIYGHSAGAQFVHRLVLFLPEARFAAAMAANAGWYTMPTFLGSAFPYRLSNSPSTTESLKRALSRHLIVLLGEQDTDASDPYLRRTSSAIEQGLNRLERGHAFYAMAQKQPAQLGAVCNWRLVTVAQAAHSDAQMMPVAVRELLLKSSCSPVDAERTS